MLVAAGLLVFLFFNGRAMSNAMVEPAQNLRTSIFNQLSFIGTFISELKKTKALTEENITLKEKILTLSSQLASEQDLIEQNNSLREALKLEMIKGWKTTDAGAYNLQFTPVGHQLLINRGRKDGINKDDIIITSSGVLLGITDNIFEHYSRVTMVTNLNFKATVKILHKDISGIVNGTVNEGLNIDFISQNDNISEGDIVVTGGNDVFPAGLVIGKVIKVGSGGGSLFKDVKVRAIADDLNISKVLVITK